MATSRLKTKYNDEIIPSLMETLKFKSIMQVPKIKKISEEALISSIKNLSFSIYSNIVVNETQTTIDQVDNKIAELRNELNSTKESTIEIRERKASSGATIEGLTKRKSDLMDRVDAELNLKVIELTEEEKKAHKDYLLRMKEETGKDPLGLN